MNLKSAKIFLSLNLKILFLSIAIGLFACAISIFAFSSPGSNQPPNGNPNFWLLNGTSTYYSNGNVGIGTNSPGMNLQVGNSTDHIGLGVNGVVDTVYFGSGSNGDGSKTISYDRSNGSMTLKGGTVGSLTSQITIDAGGNVGIGTTSPNTNLSVNGSINIPFGGSVFLGGQTSFGPAITTGYSNTKLIINGGTAGFQINNQANNAVLMSIDNSGNINAQGYPAYFARVVVRFNSTPTIISGYNVSSVSRSGTGAYTINFTTAAPNANYVCVGSGRRAADVGSDEASTQISFSSWGTSSIRVGSQDNDTNQYQDSSDVMVVCYW